MHVVPLNSHVVIVLWAVTSTDSRGHHERLSAFQHLHFATRTTFVELVNMLEHELL